MTDKSIGEYIMLDPMEVPTIQELQHAVTILKRCEVLFAKMRGKKDPPAGSMEMVGSFLEAIINNHVSKLRRGNIDEPTDVKVETIQPGGKALLPE